METSVTSKDEDDPPSPAEEDATEAWGSEEPKTPEEKTAKDEDNSNNEDTINEISGSLENKERSETGKDVEVEDEEDKITGISDVKIEEEGGKRDDDVKTKKMVGKETDQLVSSGGVEDGSNDTTDMEPKGEETSPHKINNINCRNPQQNEDASSEDSAEPLTEPHYIGLSERRTRGGASRPIIVDLSISQVMEVPHVRDGNTGGDRWTEETTNNGRQGFGVSKSVDFSMPVSMDDVNDELARVVNAINDDQLLFDPHEYGRGATTNTPVTVFTDYAESQIQGRGLHTPSREHIYQHALSIMKKRCRSSRTMTPNTRTSYRQLKTPQNVVEEDGAAFPNFTLPTVLANMDKPPLAQNPNCIFYVTQSRQHPIAPTKAWKGYEGNVYFQPVLCKKADLTPSSTPRENALNKATRRAYSTPMMMSKPAESQVTPLPQLTRPNIAGGDSQNNTAPSVTGARSVHSQRTTTAPSRQKLYSRAASTAKSRASTGRQLAVLDKQSVFSRMDSNIREDIQWISGLEAMGTLHLGGLSLPRSTAHFYKNTGGKHYKLKIQRGLVSHQLATNDQSLPTLLGVHGGRLNDSADSVAKTQYLQSQYQPCKASQFSEEDSHGYSSNLFGGYSGPFTSTEQLRRDSSSSPRRGDSSPSSDLILKDDSLHSLASVYRSSGNAVPLYSSKEVLFRNREALFLTRPNYR